MSRELFTRRRPRSRGGWGRNRKVKRRNWGRILLGTLRLTVTAALVGGVAWGGTVAARSLRRYVRSSESLAVKKLVLEGNRLVKRDEVVAALGVRSGENLMDLDLERLARNLERLPAIKRVLLQKQYPSALYVRITERTPLLVLAGPEGWLADEEGVVMGRRADFTGALPVVTGAAANNGRLTDRRAAAVVLALGEAARDAGLDWPGRLTIVDVSTPGSPVAFLDGRIPVWLGPDTYAGKLVLFAGVLEELDLGGREVSYVDLRFAERVVVGTRPPGAAAPSKERENVVG